MSMHNEMAEILRQELTRRVVSAHRDASLMATRHVRRVLDQATERALSSDETLALLRLALDDMDAATMSEAGKAMEVDK